MNITEAIAECTNQVYATRAANTARSYATAFKVLAQYFPSQGLLPSSSIEEMRMDHFIKFPGWLAQQDYSKKTIGVYLAGAKFLLNWLVIKGTLRPDYSETLRYDMATKQVSRKRESRLPRTPEKGAVEKIVDVLNSFTLPTPRRERNIALTLFLLTTGCRNNEAVQLKIKDIDLLAHTAIVIGKGSKERKVFFNSAAADAMELYWKCRGFREKNHPAFARHDKGTGQKISKLTTTSIRNIIDEITSSAGLSKGSFTPHFFRHAFAIKMLHETHDLALVQDLLGHASPTSTRVYAKIYPEELENAHKRVWEEQDTSNGT